jgi:RND family efflux transporter MFP subunit
MKRAIPSLCMLACVSCHHVAVDHEEPLAVEVHCVPVTRQSMEGTATLRGRLSAPPGGDLPVASQVAGRVVQVMVHEGDRVAAGAIVAAVDGTASRDALLQAEATLVQGKAAEANADASLERTRQLVVRGIAAKQELEDATARADQAHAAVSAAVAGADLARRTLGRVQVRSTFDGIVTRVWRGAGAIVDGTAATPLVQLAASMLAEFDVDATERQLHDIDTGQAVTVSLASGGDPIDGTVRARSTALDPATGLGLVRIAVVDMKQPVTLGAFGTATVKVGRHEAVLVVPADAMRGAVADGTEIVVCKDGKADVRTARTGWRDAKQVEIVEGVAEGERVAVDHVLGLETGAPIVEAK